MKKGNWEVLSSSQKYKNNWLEVVEDKVVSPSGRESVYATINIRKGVSVLPMDEEGNVYLIEEHRYPLDKMSIEASGGGVDDDEEYLTCAKRELEEELGIVATEWVDLGIVYPLPAYIDCPNKIYLAKNLHFTKTNQEETEMIAFKKMLLKEAVQKVISSEIFELKTCTLILKANEYLKTK